MKLVSWSFLVSWIQKNQFRKQQVWQVSFFPWICMKWLFKPIYSKFWSKYVHDIFHMIKSFSKNTLGSKRPHRNLDIITNEGYHFSKPGNKSFGILTFNTPYVIVFIYLHYTIVSVATWQQWLKLNNIYTHCCSKFGINNFFLRI